jgi:hypothetical protein
MSLQDEKSELKYKYNYISLKKFKLQNYCIKLARVEL